MKQRINRSDLYAIGAVATMLGVSVQTLRLYERRGLILPRKSRGNQRRYTKEDINRLRCLRRVINEEKVSIEGIRKLYSMIPCWDYVGCSAAEREKCPAFRRQDAGCWTYRHTSNVCGSRSCLDCDVYRSSADCRAIKSMIHHNVGAQKRGRSNSGNH